MAEQGTQGAQPWIVPETRRSALCAGLAVAVAVVLTAVWVANEESLRPHGVTIAFVLAWTVFTFTHLLLTRRAYGPLSEDGLRRALAPAARRPGRPDRARVLREQLRGRWCRADAPAWSVQVSALALGVVVLIIALPTLRESRLLLVCTLAMVAGSWANVVVMYATHYARADLRATSLAFAGTEPRAFADYLYLSLMVQATFGTTDTAVLTRAMRRTVMVQTCLAFVFNTVIVALVVSLILGTVS